MVILDSPTAAAAAVATSSEQNEAPSDTALASLGRARFQSPLTGQAEAGKRSDGVIAWNKEPISTAPRKCL